MFSCEQRQQRFEKVMFPSCKENLLHSLKIYEWTNLTLIAINKKTAEARQEQVV